jgi:hypothetical protein
MLQTHCSLEAYCRWLVFFSFFQVMEQLMEWNWWGKTKVLGGGGGVKPAPVPLYPPQIPHGLTRDRTWASTMRGQWHWAMTRPNVKVTMDLKEINWEGVCCIYVAGVWGEWWDVLNTVIGRQCPQGAWSSWVAEGLLFHEGHSASCRQLTTVQCSVPVYSSLSGTEVIFFLWTLTIICLSL